MKKDKVSIARETVKIIDDGYFMLDDQKISIKPELQHSLNNTRIYKPKQKLKIEVTQETTLSCCKRLIDEEEQNICALNFASAVHPGGGFLRGAIAQEEHLCYNSGLYHCLKNNIDFYKVNIENSSALWTNHLIYSYGVPVFRNDNDDLINPFYISFITSPAPNTTQLTKEEESEVDNVLNERISQILSVAAREGHRVLVLGSFGCGVFGNDPVKVARLFALNLMFFKYAFDRVVFAIYSNGQNTTNFDIFSKILLEKDPDNAEV